MVISQNLVVIDYANLVRDSSTYKLKFDITSNGVWEK
jgi:hypothetical protein